MRRASSRVGRLAADPYTGHTAPALAAAAGRGASCKIVRRHRQSHMHELSNDERNLLRHYAEGERVISGLQRRSLRYSDDAAPKVYDFQLIGLQFWLGATSLHTPWPSCSRSPSHPSPRSRPCSQNVEIFCRAARFACASLFCRNFSTQTGVRAATTAVSARAAASLLALPPVIQPPQENPMTTDATAPTAIPCSRRVLDSPRRHFGQITRIVQT